MPTCRPRWGTCNAQLVVDISANVAAQRAAQSTGMLEVADPLEKSVSLSSMIKSAQVVCVAAFIAHTFCWMSC